MRKILLRRKPEPRFLLAAAFGAFNRHSIRQKALLKPSWVIVAGRNQVLLTSLSPPKKLGTASPSKSHTIRRKFPTISCSIFIGDKSIPPRPTDSLLISVQVIAPRFFIATMGRKNLRRLQRRSWRVQEN